MSRRVMLGDLGPVVRLGLRDLLADEHFEVVGSEQHPGGVLVAVSDVRPDVVVLDLDDDAAAEIAARLTADFPAIKVISCSGDEPVMQVFPPFHHGESYVSELRRDLLATALRS